MRSVTLAPHARLESIMSRYRYRQPTDENAFEELCLVLFRETRPRVERYGHRGERQHGVDLLDLSGDQPLFAAQCKHHNPNKSLQPAELQAEVDKALGFPIEIGEYAFVTTAKKTAATQLAVRQLNERHRGQRRFSVQLFTWDELEGLIDQSSAAQELLGYESPSSTIVAQIETAIQPLRTVLEQNAPGATDLDDAKEWLAAGEVQAALVFLGRARKRWTQLTSVERARACGLEGSARLSQGQTEAAARLFLEARTHAPDDENAVINEVAARRLLGEDDLARELVSIATQRFPFATRAHAHAIALAVDAGRAKMAIAAIPSTIADSAEVLVAIAERSDLTDEAMSAARRVTTVAPDDAHGWYALGNRLLETEISKLEGSRRERVVSPGLQEALSAFSRVVDLTAKHGDSHNQVAALLRRIVVEGLLGHHEAVQCDVETAVRLAPDNPHVLVAAGRAAIDRDDPDAAIAFLRRAFAAAASDAAFFLGAALWNRNAHGDRAEATLIFADVARRRGARPMQAVELSVEGLLQSGNHQAARELLDDIGDDVDAVLVTTLRARIASAAGDDELARQAIEAGLRAVSEATPALARIRLAAALIARGRHADALEIVEPMARLEGDPEGVGRMFVECAIRLERDDAVLAYCARARELGVFDDYLLERELSLLHRYDPGCAFDLLRDLVARDPSSHRARVHMLSLAIRLGRLSEVASCADGLPSVTEVEPAEGAAVVDVLFELGRRRDALLFAYDLLRLHFTDHHAHRAFRNVALRTPADEKDIAAPEFAAPGTAVCIAEPGRPDRWLVIEDSLVRVGHLENEIRPEDPRAKMLLGKRVDDEVVFSDGPGVRRAATVRELLPKHVFRFRDVIQEWQVRFPEQQEMWMMRAGEGATIDLKPLFDMAEHRRDSAKRIEDLYREHPVPLAALAELLNENEVETLARVAQHEDLRLRCCAATVDEVRHATSNLAAAGEIVLHISAVGTLLMADDLDLLMSLGKPLLVSHTTMLSLRTLANDAFRGAVSRGRLGANREGPHFSVDSEEYRQARVGFFERMLKWFDANVAVTGAMELAGIDPGLRKELSGIIGDAALECAAIATRPNRILLTDDGVLAAVVRMRLGVRTIWTQLASNWMVAEGRIEPYRHARLSARLIEWGYDFTSANELTMREAARRASWRHDAPPLRQALQYLALPAVALADALRLGALLTRDAYVEISVLSERGALFIQVLNAIAQRPDADSRAFDSLRRMLPRVFGLNVLASADARNALDAWRSTDGRHPARPLVWPSARPSRR